MYAIILECSNYNKNRIFLQRNYYCPLQFFLEFKKHNKYLVRLHTEQGKKKQQPARPPVGSPAPPPPKTPPVAPGTPFSIIKQIQLLVCIN